jgi:hypothetical protein
MAAPKRPVQPKTDEEKAHEEWFYNLSADHFIFLANEWNERNLEIKLKRKKDYDGWFNYFKKMKASHIRMLLRTGLDILDAEGYAALTRWADFMSNPGRIEKVHQANMQQKRKKNGNDIVALAAQNDRLGVLKATRDKLAEQLEKGAGSRDTALLVREMTEVMTQIQDYEKRLGPKADTVLGTLMKDMPGNRVQAEHVGKRQKDKGARNTSFKSRVTIDDLEDA